MKRRWRAPSPSLIVALVALFVALGGTAYAASSLPKNSVGAKQLKKNAVTSAKIKNGSVTKKKISKATIAALKGSRGPQGLQGQQGPQGAQGPAGPGGSILAFDANATAGPTPEVLGTALGDTWSAECMLTSGEAELEVFLKTSDGSLTWDYGQETVAPGGSGETPAVNSLHVSYPAGTLTNSTMIVDDQALTAPSEIESEDQGTQLKPVAGYFAVHLTVLDTTAPAAQTCHMTVNTIPETVTAVGALKPSGSAVSRLRLLGGN